MLFFDFGWWGDVIFCFWMDCLTFFDFWGLANIFIFYGSGSAGSGFVSGSAGSGSKNVRFPVPGSVRKLPG